ncbi:hypothetical protein FBY14_1207 [Azospirillum brasilense]|nr:hypothetical protein FBY14_1207 [Azospirillum brasilense]
MISVANAGYFKILAVSISFDRNNMDTIDNDVHENFLASFAFIKTPSTNKSIIYLIEIAVISMMLFIVNRHYHISCKKAF